MLEREFEYYLEHQVDLVQKYNDKFIVIMGKTVVEAYDSIEDAYCESLEKYEEGTFLIQYCESGVEAYTQSFCSRVSFV